MKKIAIIISAILLSLMVIVMGFSNHTQTEPNTYYQVYLDDEILGVVESKEALENYINEQNDYWKQQLDISTIYAPTGLELEKITTYQTNVDKIEDVYQKIVAKSPVTVRCYQITIKRENVDSQIYVLTKGILEDAIVDFIKMYVGESVYVNYQDGNTVEITSTGRKTENIYIAEDMTIKEVHASVEEKIYTNATDLSQYLVYGNNAAIKEYTIKTGDTLDKVAFNNEISTDELLMANTNLANKNQLLYVGQTINIAAPDPQISVVLEEYVVEDVISEYKTEEIYDNTMNMGSTKVLTEGEDGLIRVTERIKTVNGIINYIKPITTEELKPTVNKVIALGNKRIPTVGTGSWIWPTDAGWSLSSHYGWRTLNGVRSFHGGIDIAGNGYGANIYAADNGVVVQAAYNSYNGYYVIINHNNGYYTYYGHMIRMPNVVAGETVSRGEVIGYIGSTGYATGPHVHFEVWYGGMWQRLDPLDVY